MTSVSAGHIILTPTKPEGSGRLQRESNAGPPHQESRALPTELPRPPEGETHTDTHTHIYIYKERERRERHGETERDINVDKDRDGEK